MGAEMTEFEILKKIEAAYNDSIKLIEKRDLEKALKVCHVGVHSVRQYFPYGNGDSVVRKRVCEMYEHFKAMVTLIPSFLPVQTQPTSASSTLLSLNLIKDGPDTIFSNVLRPVSDGTEDSSPKDVTSACDVEEKLNEWGGKASWNLVPAPNHPLIGSILDSTNENPFTQSSMNAQNTRPEGTNPFLNFNAITKQPKIDFDLATSKLPLVPQRLSKTHSKQDEPPAQVPTVEFCTKIEGTSTSRSNANTSDGSGLLTDAAIQQMIVKPDFDSSLSTIVGLTSAKEALMETILLPIAAGDNYEKGMKYSGVLLFGATGVGKSSIVKAAISECVAHMQQEITFYNVSLSELLGTFHGMTEKNLTKLFEAAAACKPSVILLDEIDSITTKRSSEEKEGNRRIKNHLLTLMDGLGSNDGIVVVGTTNRAHDMDVGFIRRFDRRIYVKLPDAKHRAIILKNLIKSLQVDDTELDYEQLAWETYNFSPADLKGLVKAAYHNANWKEPVRAFINQLEGGATVSLEIGPPSNAKITQADLIKARGLTAATNDFDEIHVIEQFARKYATDTDNDRVYEVAPEPCSLSWCLTQPSKAFECVCFSVIEALFEC